VALQWQVGRAGRKRHHAGGAVDEFPHRHAYINFHTTQFGGGEIRGDIPAEDAFRNSLVNGLTVRA